jgi:hypothetical protein
MFLAAKKNYEAQADSDLKCERTLFLEILKRTTGIQSERRDCQS